MSTPKITKSGFVGNLTGTASAAIWEGVAGRPDGMSTAEVQAVLNKGSYTGSNYLGGTGLGALRDWIEARETGSLSGSFIPYDTWNEDDNAYTLQNKNIEVKDDYDNHSSTLISGPGVRAATSDGTQIGVAGYDNIAVGVGNGDINRGEATLMNILALTPSIGGDDESGVLNKLITGTSEFGGKLQPVSLEFLSNIPSEGRRGKIELGFTGDGGNLVGENDLYFKLTHPVSEKVSLYALKNAELDNADAPKYLALEEEWNVAIFDTAEFNKGAITLTAPEGYVFDKMYVLCHWYGTAGVATTLYGGFYDGAVTDASKQVLRNNGTNKKMGAGWFTANVVNLDDTTAIAYGDCYLYNNNGSAASLNNPVNTYGIGRFSHSNDFTHFSIHGYPSNIAEGYCYIKYLLKKQ